MEVSRETKRERWDLSWIRGKKNRLDNLTAIPFFRHASLHFPPLRSQTVDLIVLSKARLLCPLDRIEGRGGRKKGTRDKVCATVAMFFLHLGPYTNILSIAGII